MAANIVTYCNALVDMETKWGLVGPSDLFSAVCCRKTFMKR